MGKLDNDQLLDSWALSLHDKSPGTRRLYGEVAGYFVSWLTDNDRPAEDPGRLVAVTRQDAEAWLMEQRKRGLSPSTVRSRWIALRNLYRWAHEEDEIAENPMARVRMEKPAPPPPALLSDDELKALFAACKGTRLTDRRDLAMVRLLLATGMRRAELVNLRLGDVDCKARVAEIQHGKGDRPRVVRFDPATAVALDRYIRTRAKHRLAAQSDRLWFSHMGFVTVKGLNTILGERARKAGIVGFHPHRLRHSFADRAKAAGMSDEDVMTLGGWTDGKVMRRYGAARATDRALSAYDTANVMEGL